MMFKPREAPEESCDPTTTRRPRPTGEYATPADQG